MNPTETLRQDLLLKLAAYLDGELSLEAFDAWFAAGTWDTDDDLVGEIELRIAEYTSGHRTAAQLKRMFRDLVEPPLVFTPGAAGPELRANSTTIGTATLNYSLDLAGDRPPATSYIRLAGVTL